MVAGGALSGISRSSIRRVDAFQQRHRPTALGFGVVKKYGDDNAGAPSVQLTYALFTTIFPLLLLLVTLFTLVLARVWGANAQNRRHSTSPEVRGRYGGKRA